VPRVWNIINRAPLLGERNYGIFLIALQAPLIEQRQKIPSIFPAILIDESLWKDDSL
jgi:hypothetical protein